MTLKMRIIFICSSLEPGRDGVGDYTRRLAVSLIKAGHRAMAIALNDKYVERESAATQRADGYELNVLRFPAVWSSTKRFNRAKEGVVTFNPEWLSLQFVLYAYNPKGIPFALGKKLKELGSKRKWHIPL